MTAHTVESLGTAPIEHATSYGLSSPARIATLPAGAQLISAESVARIPGTAPVLAGGFTHAKNAPFLNVVAVILQYR
jgi:hypothetical protein